MISLFADLCADLERAITDEVRRELLRRYRTDVGDAEADRALDLLRGRTMIRLLTPRQLADVILERTGLPRWLLDASRRHGGTLVDTAMHMLPPAPFDVERTDGDLSIIPALDRAALLDRLLVARLPERLVLGRIACGLRPARYADDLHDVDAPQAEARVMLTTILYAHRSPVTGGRTYDHLTVGIYNGNVLVPIARVPNTLTEADNAIVDDLVERRGLERFGPTVWVTSGTIVEITYQDVAPSTRTKSGVKLIGASLVGLRPDATLDHLPRSVPGTL
jgi:hypothetical protein